MFDKWIFLFCFWGTSLGLWPMDTPLATHAIKEIPLAIQDATGGRDVGSGQPWLGLG